MVATFAQRLADSGRRRFVRVPLGVTVEYSAKSDDHLYSMEGVARDISLGGMFIESEIPCSFGEELLVSLRLPDDPFRLVLPATVRWTAAAGMGVQFGLLGAKSTHRVAEYVRR